MKKVINALLVLLPLVGFGQKKANGTIYIEHPAINVVDAFTKAMVLGDTAAMARMMTDDFKAQNVVTSTPFTQGTGKAAYLRSAKMLQEQLDYYSIKTIEGTYPDAFEYAKNSSDNNAVTVNTWDARKGVHKKTGVKADIYLHRSFELTKDNKIRRIANYSNPEVNTEINNAYAERTNGTIYNQHQSINNLRLMMAAAEHGDMEKYYSYFDKNATFWDINNPDWKATNLDAEKAGDKAILDKFEFVSIEQYGYPDYMHYEMGNNNVLYSWWILHLRRKSDKKIVNVPMHYEHDVNAEGKIVNTISYYNAGLLK